MLYSGKQSADQLPFLYHQSSCRALAMPLSFVSCRLQKNSHDGIVDSHLSPTYAELQQLLRNDTNRVVRISVSRIRRISTA